MLSKKEVNKWTMVLLGSFLLYKGFSFPPDLARELALGSFGPRIAQVVGVSMIGLGLLL